MFIVFTNVKSIFALGQNNSTCSAETGQCQCTPGWVGQHCDRPCSSDSYGIQCSEKCACKNGASCNPQNGLIYY